MNWDRYVLGVLPGDIITLCCREHGFLDVAAPDEGNLLAYVNSAEAHELEAHP